MSKVLPHHGILDTGFVIDGFASAKWTCKSTSHPLIDRTTQRRITQTLRSTAPNSIPRVLPCVRTRHRLSIAGESHTTQFFGRDLLRMTHLRRQQFLDDAVAYWRTRGFPYSRLTSIEVEREFGLLQASSTREAFSGNILRTATTGLRLANSFHPQMWHVRSQQHRYAPVDYFQDDKRLRELLARAPRFWPNRRCWNAQCLRSLFRIYSSGRVANFRPLVARAIIERFSPPGGRVLDYCAGFGGRLLGSLVLDRHYVGIDAAALQVKGLKEMWNALRAMARGTAELHHARAEDFLLTLPPHSVDLVFSSPPFFDVEIYDSDRAQSALRYPKYQDWLRNFLKVIIEEARRILRPGGIFVINIADNRRQSLRSDTLGLAAPIFGAPNLIRMNMHSRPAQRATRTQTFRWEPIYVFRNPPR